MHIGTLYKNFLQGNYRFGQRITNQLFENKKPGTARRAGGVVDTAVGAGLTGFFGLATLGSVVTGASAIVGLATLTAPPVALVTVAVSALYVALGGLMVSMGAGFLSAARNKLLPQLDTRKFTQGVTSGVKTVSKPALWAGRGIKHVFKSAHDEVKAENPVPPSPGLAPGKHKL